jgi:hypothetical protein
MQIYTWQRNAMGAMFLPRIGHSSYEVTPTDDINHQWDKRLTKKSQCNIRGQLLLGLTIWDRLLLGLTIWDRLLLGLTDYMHGKQLSKISAFS